MPIFRHKQANNNDAFVKQQVASVVDLLGFKVQRLITDRAEDIDVLSKALDAQVKVMQAEILGMRADISAPGARPAPACL